MAAIDGNTDTRAGRCQLLSDPVLLQLQAIVVRSQAYALNVLARAVKDLDQNGEWQLQA